MISPASLMPRIEELARLIGHKEVEIALLKRFVRELTSEEKVDRDRVCVSYSETGAKGNVHMKALNSRFNTENRLLF